MDVLLENEQCECQSFPCLLAKGWSLCYFPPKFLTCEIQSSPGTSYMGLLFQMSHQLRYRRSFSLFKASNLVFWQLLTVVETLALGQGGSGELSRASPIHSSWRSFLLSSQLDILWRLCIRSRPFVEGGQGSLWQMVSGVSVCCWMTSSGLLVILFRWCS